MPEYARASRSLSLNRYKRRHNSITIRNINTMSNTLTHTHTLSLQSDPSLFQQSNSLTDVGFKIDHDSYQRELRYIDADEKEVTSLFPGILSSSINSESSVDAYLHRTAKLVSQPKDNDSNGDHVSDPQTFESKIPHIPPVYTSSIPNSFRRRSEIH